MTEAQKIVGIILHTVVDLAAGSFISNAINTFFFLHDPPAAGVTIPELEYTDFWKTAGFAAVQAVVTMLVAEEARNLLWNGGNDDPTAGVMFIVSLYQQPTLWAKLASLYFMMFQSFKNSGITGSDSGTNQ